MKIELNNGLKIGFKDGGLVVSQDDISTLFVLLKALGAEIEINGDLNAALKNGTPIKFKLDNFSIGAKDG